MCVQLPAVSVPKPGEGRKGIEGEGTEGVCMCVRVSARASVWTRRWGQPS